VGGLKFLKQCLQALLPTPSPTFLPDLAHLAPAFSIVSTDREPGTGTSQNNREKAAVLHITGSEWF